MEVTSWGLFPLSTLKFLICDVLHTSANRTFNPLTLPENGTSLVGHDRERGPLEMCQREATVKRESVTGVTTRYTVHTSQNSHANFDLACSKCDAGLFLAAPHSVTCAQTRGADFAIMCIMDMAIKIAAGAGIVFFGYWASTIIISLLITANGI